MLTYEPLREKSYHIAASGGPDSMALLNITVSSRKDVVAYVFDHGTTNSTMGIEILSDYCNFHRVPMVVGTIENANIPPGRSAEDYWRECRYRFFSNRNLDIELLMGHHLDDQVENWIFTSMHGNPMLIPYRNQKYNILRPFLVTRKSDILDYCVRHGVKYHIDTSNSDTKYKRNYIRNVLIEHALVVNPGIHTTIKNKIVSFLSASKDVY
jgi:tRNA(Ile)-lysidine synthase